MSTYIMNFPNISKVRRLIGSDDAEIDELLMDKQSRITRNIERGQAQHSESWIAKDRFHKAQGKLRPFTRKIYALLKNGKGRWSLKDILGHLSQPISVELIDKVQIALQNLDDRGLVICDSNRINREPGVPLVDMWFVPHDAERALFVATTEKAKKLAGKRLAKVYGGKKKQ